MKFFTEIRKKKVGKKGVSVSDRSQRRETSDIKVRRPRQQLDGLRNQFSKAKPNVKETRLENHVASC